MGYVELQFFVHEMQILLQRRQMRLSLGITSFRDLGLWFSLLVEDGHLNFFLSHSGSDEILVRFSFVSQQRGFKRPLYGCGCSASSLVCLDLSMTFDTVNRSIISERSREFPFLNTQFYIKITPEKHSVTGKCFV